MRRILTVFLFILVAATLRAESSSSIRCGDLHSPSEVVDINPKYELRFVPVDAATFRSSFRMAKKSSYGRYAFFIARKESGTPDEQSTTLLIGASVDGKRFFRLVDDKGKWPTYYDDNYADDESLTGVPAIARIVNDGKASLFRLMIESRFQGGKSRVDTETTYVIAVQPQPRIVASIGCTEVSLSGKCNVNTSGDALACDWSRSLHDFACTSSHAYADWLLMTRPSERRFTLFGGKSLPVTKPGMASFRGIQELDHKLRADGALLRQRDHKAQETGQPPQTDDLLLDQRVMVEGVGLLRTLDVPLFGISIYVASGLYDDLELRAFAFPQEGEPISIRLPKISDGHEPPEERRVANADSHKSTELYTPTGEDWSVAMGESFALGTAQIFTIVLHDGKGRGLFWLAIDRTAKPAVMSLLRIAADVGPYDHCWTFIYPASASAVKVTGDHAVLTIEPHSRRGQGGEAIEWEGDAEVPCHVQGTVTWDHEKGFILTTTDVPCQPNEVRVGVVIDALGHLSTAPLRFEKDQ